MIALATALLLAAAQEPQCPPPKPPAEPPAPGTITGSSICGATIIGGTISGATIIGGTISGANISGGTISDGKAAPPPASPPSPSPSPQPPPAPANADQPPKPQGRVDPEKKKRVSPGSALGKKRVAGGPDDEDDDDEDASLRALERALVQRGALLLPPWGFEISPGVTYGLTSQDSVLNVTADNGSTTTVSVRRRLHQVTGSLTARLGLPLDLQLEASLPASIVLNDIVVAGTAQGGSSSHGFGDPRFALTWQMARGGSVMPDLLLAANFKPATASSPFDAKQGAVGLGAGYASVGGTLTAAKSADPLVLLVNASFIDNLPADTSQGRRDPGNTYGLGGGAILAVSPDTSLSFLLDCHYKPQDSLDGKAVPGSDETFAVLQLGLGRVLSRGVLLNVTAAMGLTADSPNFQLGMSLPVRF